MAPTAATSAKQFTPVLDGPVGSQQRAGALVTPHHNLQQILGGRLRELAHPEVVDDQQRTLGIDSMYCLR